MNSLLEFEKITFAYEGNNQPALQNLSMIIPSGKKCAILGHNGSGKSTALLLANGLLKPSSGRVLWKGEPLVFSKKGLKGHRQNTGLLFQNADEMLISPVVLDDLSYGLINAGYSGDGLHQKIKQLMKRYQLEHLQDRPIHHLSLGEKRRVALAGVMGLEPELLLLDEPTAYLDPAQTKVFLNELHHISKAGTTIVMSTHDLNLAYEWADWIYVIEKGQLVFAGTPDELFMNEYFVLEKELDVPLLFHLKQLVQANANTAKDNVKTETKEEILFYIKEQLENRRGRV
ncbi:energy-coupling factor ABC transporter ATP-binding protein [Schinkia sp. CFF1]